MKRGNSVVYIDDDFLLYRFIIHQFNKIYIDECLYNNQSGSSSVDLTIIHIVGENAGEEIDMGSSWDYFGEKSSISTTKINLIQQKNRLTLKNLMEMFGFIPYEKEWWHFTLKDEPFQNKYFDFSTN
tara:strand:- start:214 stop:594 length:381 start_codon:yes stop_codon:yes gene_type:complete